MKLIRENAINMKSHKISNKELFITIMLISFVVTIISIVFTRGVALQCILHRNSNNAFMDFFNSIVDVGGRNPYENAVIYPPLAELIFSVCRKIIPINWLMGDNAYLLRNSQMGLIIYMLILLVCVFALYFILRRFNKNDYADRKNEIFALTVVMSFPMLYTYERGNIIILSLIMICLFGLLYDSKSKFGREIGLISLAVAAGIKIYPAIYGVILIKEKRWKEAIRCVIYGVLAFILPSFFYGGIGGLMDMLGNLSGTTVSMSKNGYGYKVSIYAIVSLINEVTGANINYKVCMVIFALMMAAAFILTKTKWKELLILSLPCIMIPQFSYAYTLTFLILPIAVFVNDENETSNKTNCIYIALLAILMAYIPITKALFTTSIKGPVYYLMFPQTLIEMVGLVIITVFLFVETIMSYTSSRKGVYR